MAVEAKRGCGYRKVGGLYLCSNAPDTPCCRFPFELKICPVCNQGVKQSRNVQWFDPGPFLAEKGGCKIDFSRCPIEHTLRPNKAILIWIGAKFYATPEHFLDEAKRMGISRRVKSIPRGFELGKTEVFFAHPHCFLGSEKGFAPGVFAMVKNIKFELIVTEKPTEKMLRKLKDTRIMPVIVPEHDPDHYYGVDDDPSFEEIWNGDQRQTSP